MIKLRVNNFRTRDDPEAQKSSVKVTYLKMSECLSIPIVSPHLIGIH